MFRGAAHQEMNGNNEYVAHFLVHTCLLLAGASKQLGLVIEGESLLNDGAAIVVFNVFKTLSIPGSSMNGKSVLSLYLQTSI